MSRRSRRGWYWAAVATAIAVAVAGTVVAATSYVHESNPRTVVAAYFDALAAGRAADALALGDIPDGDRSYLTDDVLKAQLDVGQISGLTTGDVQRQGSRAVVAVHYRLDAANLDPTDVTDTVPLHRHGAGWLLERSAVVVPPIAANAQTRVALAGTALPTQPILLLPGALPVQTNAAELGFDRSATVVTFDGAAPGVSPVITDAGQAAIGAALDAAVATCLANTSSMPNCPLYVTGARVVPGTLTGTVTTPPSARSTLRLAEDPGGAVTARGTFVVDASWRQLDFDNIARATAGSLTLSYSATVFLVDPIVVQWSAT